jgi:uncharacterized surface protein with fasciclin (FAS1) repeats
MKSKIHSLTLSFSLAFAILFSGCQSGNQADNSQTSDAATETNAVEGGQSTVADDVSQPNVVKIAVGSADHSTLVTAVQAAGLVDALSNNGPFTVFAPTNAAFEKLPAGTVEDLLKPENKGKLEDILYHHVIVGTYKTESFSDGQTVSMFAGGSCKVVMKDGKMTIDGANVVASVPASNGIVHVIDAVLLPGGGK